MNAKTSSSIRRSRTSAVVAAVFPGSRVVWWVALASAVVAAVFGFRLLNAQVGAYTGSNSVDVAAVVGTADPGERFCVRDVDVPAGSGRVQVWLGFPDAKGPVELRGELTAGERSWKLRTRIEHGFGDWQTFTLDPPTGDRTVTRGTLCLRTTAASKASVDLGGSSINQLPGRPGSDIDGKPLGVADVGVRFQRPVGDEPTVWDDLSTSIERATLFKGLPGGTLLLWLFLLGFPFVAYGVVRVAATVDRRSARSLAWRAGLLACYASFAWALMTPIFQGADESEHAAYAQHVAETGDRASAGYDDRAPYSSEMNLLMGALRHSSTILDGGGRPRWNPDWPRWYDAVDDGADAANGGGYTESASGHSPLYYRIVAVPYRVLDGALDLPQLVLAMRLTTALMAALVAVLAVLAAALVFPRARAAWWLAGTVVALQPVFSSVSATVNNDTLVTLLSSLAIFLLLHAWRHGPRPVPMALLGVVTLLAPVAKVIGFALWPVVALGLLCVLLQHRSVASLLRLLLVPAAAGVAALLWIFVLAPLLGGGTGAIYNAHPSAAAAGAEAAATSHEAFGTSRSLQLRYLWATLVPEGLSGGELFRLDWPLYRIYVERGWGRFGWLNVGLSPELTWTIAIGLIGAWGLAAVAALRRRRTWRGWLGAAVILLGAVAASIVFVSVAYTTGGPRPVLGEQGRYLFPAIVALGVLFGAAVLAWGERFRHAMLGALGVLLPALAALAWLTALREWYQ